MLDRIIQRWKALDWMPPLPNLDRHLEHIGGGASVLAVGLAAGLPWLVAAFISTGVFAIVEGLTMYFKHNYKDSIFDYVQYLFHWLLFFAHNGWWILAGVYLAVWLAAYIYMLLNKW